jgi:hypothetical protein
MNTRLIISLLCAGALAFACGPRSRNEAPVALASMLPIHSRAVIDTPRETLGEVSRETPRETPRETSRRASNVRAEVKLNARFDIAVEPHAVRFALVVKNVGGKHAELNFSDGQSHDFVVIDSTGREVWHWSDGRIFTQSVQNKQLGAGESMRVSEAWKRHDAAAGHYTAIATLKSSNYPTEQRATFVIP